MKSGRGSFWEGKAGAAMKLKAEPGALITAAALLLLIEEGDLLPVAAAAIIHEAGHIAAILICGLAPESVTAGLGGLRIKYAGGGYIEDAVVALAGPLASAGAAALSALALKCSPFFTGVNAALATVNALPVSGLDGGRAVFAAVTLLSSPDAAERSALVLDAVCLAALGGLGVLAALRYNNYTFLISAGYLCVMCCKNGGNVVQ